MQIGAICKNNDSDNEVEFVANDVFSYGDSAQLNTQVVECSEKHPKLDN